MPFCPTSTLPGDLGTVELTLTEDELLLPGALASLVDAIRMVPDPRAKHLVTHPLPILLGLTACAKLCGATSVRGMIRWARGQGAGVLAALPQPPSMSLSCVDDILGRRRAPRPPCRSAGRPGGTGGRGSRRGRAARDSHCAILRHAPRDVPGIASEGSLSRSAGQLLGLAGPRDLSRSITGHACCPGEGAAYAPARDGTYRRPRDVTGSGDAAPTERSHGLLRVLSTPSQRRAVLPWLRRYRYTHGSHAADSVSWPIACPAAARTAARGALAGRAAARNCTSIARSGGRPAARQAAQLGPAAQRAGAVGGRSGGRGRPGHGGDVLGPLGRRHGSGLRSRRGAARADGRSERECHLRTGGRAADGGSAAGRQHSPEFLPLRVRLRQRVRKPRGFEPGRPAVGDHARAGRHQHPPGNRFALVGPALTDIEAETETDANADANAVTNGHLHPVPLLVQLNR
ncbi:hypothetical protein P3T36_000013 [Kitasatospora sp. MAP12-15]|nr:hypothetical protein [Kitasatospora sp. MAP12-44]